MENTYSANNDALDYLRDIYGYSDNEPLNEAAINHVFDKKRVSKRITKQEDIDYILSIDHNKACERSTIMDLFADYGNGPRFNPYDLIDIPPNSYGGISSKDDEYKTSTKKNKNTFTTTVGLYIFNKSFMEPFSDILGYINGPVNKDKYKKINKELSSELLNDKISVRQLKDFIMQCQILMSCTTILAPSHTTGLYALEAKLDKKKEELEKKYKDKLDKGDLVAAKQYEADLLNYAKDVLKDDEVRDIIDSGARASWDNNFKNMYVTRGPVKRTDGTYKIVRDSYINGMHKEDFAAIADSAVQGAYDRSQRTASGGYVERQLLGSTAHLRCLPKGSDCKTNRTIDVDLDSKNIGSWIYSFIMENGHPVEITEDNKDKYIGKRVKMRYSCLCEAKDGICEVCASSLFNRIGIANMGLATPILGSSLKNAFMKNFHDSTVSLQKIDVEKLFGE